MRVLHLIDAASPQATDTTLALLADAFGRLPEVEEHVLLLGGTALQRSAQAAGLPAADVTPISTPFGRAILALPAALAWARRLGAVDLVHCWSVGALALACLVFRRSPRLLTLTLPPAPPTVRWLNPIIGAGRDPAAPANVAVLALSNTVRSAALAGGLPEAAMHVLRPGLDLSRVPHGARAEIRKSWAIESDQVKVVALLSDPPDAADAVTATMAVGLAAEPYESRGSGAPVLRLLLHPRQRHRARAMRSMRHIDRAERLILDERLARPWSVLPGCDLALVLGAVGWIDGVPAQTLVEGAAGGGLSLLWAMAANVPIVAEATYAVSEVVEDRHSALLARPGQPKSLAHRISQLVDEPQLAWQLRDTARHEAFSFFSRQRYCQSLLGVYRQLVDGKPVHVPPLPVTGGLRFAPRP